MRYDQRFDDRQAETGAGIAARGFMVVLYEWFERARNVFALHADAGIANLDGRDAPRLESRAELDAATQAAYRALPQADQRVAMDGMRASLYQTTLTEEGVAKEGSLRGIQVYVPMPLIAPLDWLPGSDDANEAERGFAALALCLPLVEGLGGHRTRGLGRVQLSLLTHLPAAAEAQP